MKEMPWIIIKIVTEKGEHAEHLEVGGDCHEDVLQHIHLLHHQVEQQQRKPLHTIETPHRTTKHVHHYSRKLLIIRRQAIYLFSIGDAEEQVEQ